MYRLLSLLICAACTASIAQPLDPRSYQDLRWRCIGPFRGGRTVAATGVPGHPGQFLIGVNNGGVWRTDDYGQTWNPIFDDQPTGSIGAIAIAPSDPNTIYVGSGEGLQRPDLSTGNGLYRSTDAGNTWKHLGLEDGQQIGAIIVDPKISKRLFVAVLGHPYGPNETRGVYRSLDGGDTWQKVLYKDENTGAIAVAFDPQNPQIVYADLWAARQGPWENGGWQGTTSGLFKSLDGGNTWIQLTKGLPTAKEGLGRIGFSIAPSNPNKLYAMVDADKKGGVYRSGDAGDSWTLVNSEERVWGRGSDFAEVKVDPRDANTIFVANTSTYRSTDGGVTYTAWKGAPGGDDYHTIWIDPTRPDVVLLASDQGATVTVNRGRTWSSWYNQPTAQFYHVSTDNRVPYWVYGGQQESGSAGVASRGNDGEITMRDWHPVGAEEYGYVAPDPLNPNIVYGGKLQKWDRVTGQVQDVSPTGEGYRFLRTAPVLFSQADPHRLYFAGNHLFMSKNGGHSWSVLSPDLTREHPEVPESVGVYRAQQAKVERRGVIYTVATSPKDVHLIWAGTDDGLVWNTRNGGQTWNDVTPKDLTSWSKVSMVEAGQNDGTAYMAVNRIRLDDQRPHIYRTDDYGKSWREIVSGLPQNGPVNTVREEPLQKVLFCGTETGVYFSLDGGSHWNSLRLNMPATSIRDLVIHRDINNQEDLVVGTHGRSFWILDDILPLLAIRSGTGQTWLTAENTYGFRRNTNTDTPLPPEVPVGKNPPDGGIIDYYLPKDSADAELDILDQSGNVLRHYSSTDKPDEPNPKDLNVPTYWIRSAQKLGTSAGHHRFIWDLYLQPNGFVPYYPISAIYKDTPSVPTSPLAPPGLYKVRLKVDGAQQEQSLLLLKDPRVAATDEALKHEYALAKSCYDTALKMQELAKKQTKSTGAPRSRGRRRSAASPTYAGLADAFMGLMGDVDSADAEPTEAMLQRYQELVKQAQELEKR